jgi:hypothetical protein
MSGLGAFLRRAANAPNTSAGNSSSTNRKPAEQHADYMLAVARVAALVVAD